MTAENKQAYLEHFLVKRNDALISGKYITN